jgi:hypothetical protein
MTCGSFREVAGAQEVLRPTAKRNTKSHGIKIGTETSRRDFGYQGTIVDTAHWLSCRLTGPSTPTIGKLV